MNLVSTGIQRLDKRVVSPLTLIKGLNITANDNELALAA